MADLAIVTTSSFKGYAKTRHIPKGYTDQGLAMTVFRGEMAGIMTSTADENELFLTRLLATGQFSGFSALPDRYLAQGRVSTAVLEDRLYVVRRGTNDGVYLSSSPDLDQWLDHGRVGSKYAASIQSPAVATFAGKLYIAGVGSDNYIYYTIVDKYGNREKSWTKLGNTGTRESLAMVVWDGELFMFHTGWNSDGIYWSKLSNAGDEWSDLGKYSTNIYSGVSSTIWRNQIYLTWRGADNTLSWSVFDGHWKRTSTVPDRYTKGDTGSVAYLDRFVMSFADAYADESIGPVFDDLSEEDDDDSIEREKAESESRFQAQQRPNLVRKITSKLSCF